MSTEEKKQANKSSNLTERLREEAWRCLLTSARVHDPRQNLPQEYQTPELSKEFKRNVIQSILQNRILRPKLERDQGTSFTEFYPKVLENNLPFAKYRQMVAEAFPKECKAEKPELDLTPRQAAQCAEAILRANKKEHDILEFVEEPTNFYTMPTEEQIEKDPLALTYINMMNFISRIARESVSDWSGFDYSVLPRILSRMPIEQQKSFWKHIASLYRPAEKALAERCHSKFLSAEHSPSYLAMRKLEARGLQQGKEGDMSKRQQAIPEHIWNQNIKPFV
jgi:hypothetical protein